jgi:septum formation protein
VVPVLAADTTVALGDRVLGKPGTAENAVATLLLLAGQAHQVHTAVVVRAGSRVWRRVVSTTVTFRTLSIAEIERYVATGEPLDRAGAYAIQGGAGGFVHRIAGSYTAVVGLPLGESLAMLHRAGRALSLGSE